MAINLSENNLPQLPPLRIAHVGKYSYLWIDKRAKSYRKLANSSVGKIRDGGKTGLIVWKDAFLDAFPALKAFDTYREEVVTGTHSKSTEYRLVFRPIATLAQNNSIQQIKLQKAGATWAFDYILYNSPFLIALNRTFNREDRSSKLLSLAYYICLEQNINFVNYLNFAAQTRLAYPNPLTLKEVNEFILNISDVDILSFFANLQEITLRRQSRQGQYFIFDCAYPHNIMNKVRLGDQIFTDLKEQNYAKKACTVTTAKANETMLRQEQNALQRNDRVLLIVNRYTGMAHAYTTYNSELLTHADLFNFIHEDCILNNFLPELVHQEEVLSASAPIKERFLVEQSVYLHEAAIKPEPLPDDGSTQRTTPSVKAYNLALERIHNPLEKYQQKQVNAPSDQELDDFSKVSNFTTLEAHAVELANTLNQENKTNADTVSSPKALENELQSNNSFSENLEDFVENEEDSEAVSSLSEAFLAQDIATQRAYKEKVALAKNMYSATVLRNQQDQLQLNEQSQSTLNLTTSLGLHTSSFQQNNLVATEYTKTKTNLSPLGDISAFSTAFNSHSLVASTTFAQQNNSIKNDLSNESLAQNLEISQATDNISSNEQDQDVVSAENIANPSDKATQGSGFAGGGLSTSELNVKIFQKSSLNLNQEQSLQTFAQNLNHTSVTLDLVPKQTHTNTLDTLDTLDSLDSLAKEQHSFTNKQAHDPSSDLSKLNVVNVAQESVKFKQNSINDDLLSEVQAQTTLAHSNTLASINSLSEQDLAFGSESAYANSLLNQKSSKVKPSSNKYLPQQRSVQDITTSVANDFELLHKGIIQTETDSSKFIPFREQKTASKDELAEAKTFINKVNAKLLRPSDLFESEQKQEKNLLRNKRQHTCYVSNHSSHVILRICQLLQGDIPFILSIAPQNRLFKRLFTQYKQQLFSAMQFDFTQNKFTFSTSLKVSYPEYVENLGEKTSDPRLQSLLNLHHSAKDKARKQSSTLQIQFIVHFDRILAAYQKLRQVEGYYALRYGQKLDGENRQLELQKIGYSESFLTKCSEIYLLLKKDLKALENLNNMLNNQAVDPLSLADKQKLIQNLKLLMDSNFNFGEVQLFICSQEYSSSSIFDSLHAYELLTNQERLFSCLSFDVLREELQSKNPFTSNLAVNLQKAHTLKKEFLLFLGLNVYQMFNQRMYQGLQKYGTKLIKGKFDIKSADDLMQELNRVSSFYKDDGVYYKEVLSSLWPLFEFLDLKRPQYEGYKEFCNENEVAMVRSELRTTTS